MKDAIEALGVDAWRNYRNAQGVAFRGSWAINTYGQDAFLRKAREAARVHLRDFNEPPSVELVIARVTLDGLNRR